MSQQRLKPIGELRPYQIRLMGKNGETKLQYDTMCYDDDEAIDKLFALNDVSYVRFEITSDDQTISQGSHIK